MPYSPNRKKNIQYIREDIDGSGDDEYHVPAVAIAGEERIPGSIDGVTFEENCQGDSHING